MVVISHTGRGSILLVCVAANARKRSDGYKCTGNRSDADPEGQPDASAQGERGYGWIEQQVDFANGVEIVKYYGPSRRSVVPCRDGLRVQIGRAHV